MQHILIKGMFLSSPPPHRLLRGILQGKGVVMHAQTSRVRGDYNKQQLAFFINEREHNQIIETSSSIFSYNQCNVMLARRKMERKVDVVIL
jgi:hypothetical protein